MALNQKDTELINKLVEEGVKDGLRRFAKKADELVQQELLQVKQALNGANRNILKLQAQLSAQRDVLLGAGTCSKANLDELAEARFKELAKDAAPKEDEAKKPELVGAKG